MNNRWNEHSGKIIDTIDGVDIIDCHRCGFRHIIPIPTIDEPNNQIRVAQRTTGKTDYFDRQKRDVEWWELVYKERYTRFKRFMPQGHRILDVGCGSGLFLEIGKKLNWDTLGIEPSLQGAELARQKNLEVINKFFTAETVERVGEFDVVHSKDTLEHMPDPKGAVSLYNKLLRPGGLICLIVANDYNIIQETLRSNLGYDPWWVVPSKHINYFTIASIKQLIESSEFEILYLTTTFPMELFLLMGDNYIGNEQLGDICHHRRKTLEFNLSKGSMSPFKEKLFEAFANLGIGREIEIIAIKK